LWDTASSLQVYILEKDQWRCTSTGMLAGINMPARIDMLRGLGVKTLICGAMSGCMRNTVEANGIVVRPWISGGIEQVLAAVARDRISDYLMPGCGGRGRCGRGERPANGPNAGQGGRRMHQGFSR
jgi:predicted Fe-Mo cluster-binding NifX family protein